MILIIRTSNKYVEKDIKTYLLGRHTHMGKLKDGYEEKKPSKRQTKKQKKEEMNLLRQQEMCSFLEEKWKHLIAYSCAHCLEAAYKNELHGCQMEYVSDEELIASSKGKIK